MLLDAVRISHVLLSVGLIVLILIQRGKGAEAGAAFGSGASGTVFGAAGSGSFLTRLTGVLATLFFVTSLSLAYLAGQVVPESVLEQSVLSAPAEEGTPDLLPLPDGLPADLPAELPPLVVPQDSEDPQESPKPQ